MLDRDGSRPGQDRVGWLRFSYATHKGEQFKIYELLISGIFHLIILDY